MKKLLIDGQSGCFADQSQYFIGVLVTIRLRDILNSQNESQIVVTVRGNKPIFATNQESQVSLKSNDSS